MKLDNCPRCGGSDTYIYHRGYKDAQDCVYCKVCGYFNTFKMWQTGKDGLGWDKLWIKRVNMLNFDIERLQAEILLRLANPENEYCTEYPLDAGYTAMQSEEK